MSVAYVSGQTGGTTHSGTTSYSIALTYHSTAGNTLFLVINGNAGVISVIDNGGNTWNLQNNGILEAASQQYGWVVNANSVGSVTIQVSNPATSGNCVTAALAEYSGVTGAQIFEGGSGTSGSTASVSLTDNVGGNFLVAGFVASTLSTFALTSHTGNLRQTSPAETASFNNSVYQCCIVDNTGSPTTCSATWTGSSIGTPWCGGTQFGTVGYPTLLAYGLGY
jgi:hypothetical protein